MVDEKANVVQGVSSNAKNVPGICNEAIQVLGTNNSWLSLGSLSLPCNFDIFANSCPGVSVAFWLRLRKSAGDFPRKVLGFYEIGEQRKGFLIWSEDPEHIGVQFTGSNKKCVSMMDVNQEMWTHFVFVASFRDTQVYRNGELLPVQRKCIVIQTTSNKNAELRTGNASAEFDELLIWHRTLSEARVTKAFKYSLGMCGLCRQHSSLACTSN